jgi:LmbE family N-acetylglucosaminyl deacetylase
MLRVHLGTPSQGRLSVLAVGAHPDDIEIGAGGLALSLTDGRPGLRVHYVLLTGTADRHLEARQAASSFFAGAELTVALHDLPEGTLPSAWSQVKDTLAAAASSFAPDVIIAPSTADAHQDHRTVAEIIPTVFRDQLSLGYEIPKWDGDLGRGQPGVYWPLSADTVRRKVELLHKCYPSQRGRDWWDDEVFVGLARLRGMECRAPYAEAFTCSKLALTG